MILTLIGTEEREVEDGNCPNTLPMIVTLSNNNMVTYVTNTVVSTKKDTQATFLAV